MKWDPPVFQIWHWVCSWLSCENEIFVWFLTVLINFNTIWPLGPPIHLYSTVRWIHQGKSQCQCTMLYWGGALSDATYMCPVWLMSHWRGASIHGGKTQGCQTQWGLSRRKPDTDTGELSLCFPVCKAQGWSHSGACHPGNQTQTQGRGLDLHVQVKPGQRDKWVDHRGIAPTCCLPPMFLHVFLFPCCQTEWGNLDTQGAWQTQGAAACFIKIGLSHSLDASPMGAHYFAQDGSGRKRQIEQKEDQGKWVDVCPGFISRNQSKNGRLSSIVGDVEGPGWQTPDTKTYRCLPLNSKK